MHRIENSISLQVYTLYIKACVYTSDGKYYLVIGKVSV